MKRVEETEKGGGASFLCQIVTGASTEQIQGHYITGLKNCFQFNLSYLRAAKVPFTFQEIAYQQLKKDVQVSFQRFDTDIR